MVFIRRKRLPMRFRRKKVMRRRHITRGAKSAKGTTMKGRNIVMRRLFAKLPYESGNIGAVVSSSLNVVQFRANGIYDPDYSGIGHQPRGHDEYANIFRTYRVHGVLVEVFAQNLTPFTQSLIAIYPHKSTSVPTDITGIMETPDMFYKTTNVDGRLYMKKYVSMAKLFGKRKGVINNDLDYSAALNADPVVNGYISIIQGSMNGSEINHACRVKLTYYVEFSDPLLLTQS